MIFDRTNVTLEVLVLPSVRNFDHEDVLKIDIWIQPLIKRSAL